MRTSRSTRIPRLMILKDGKRHRADRARAAPSFFRLTAASHPLNRRMRPRRGLAGIAPISLEGHAASQPKVPKRNNKSACHLYTYPPGFIAAPLWLTTTSVIHHVEPVSTSFESDRHSPEGFPFIRASLIADQRAGLEVRVTVGGRGR